MLEAYALRAAASGGLRPTRRIIPSPTPREEMPSRGLRPRMSWYGLSGGLRPGISCEADPPLSAPDDLVVRHLRATFVISRIAKVRDSPRSVAL